MEKIKLYLAVIGMVALVARTDRLALAFVFPASQNPGYIEAQLVLDQDQEIDPAYIQAITKIVNLFGENLTEDKVKDVLAKMDNSLVVRLANIALLAGRGSIDPDINKPVSVIIEFKDQKSKEDILRGLARQQAYEMKNGLGGLRIGPGINENTIKAESIGILGIRDLIVLLLMPEVVKINSNLDAK